MTTRTRRRWLLGFPVATGVVVVVLGAMGLGWHLKAYGWWRGELFFRGFPVSCYSNRVRAGLAWMPDGAIEARPAGAAEALVRGNRYLPGALADALWGGPARDALPGLKGLLGDESKPMRGNIVTAAGAARQAIALIEQEAPSGPGVGGAP